LRTVLSRQGLQDRLTVLQPALQDDVLSNLLSTRPGPDRDYPRSHISNTPIHPACTAVSLLQRQQSSFSRLQCKQASANRFTTLCVRPHLDAVRRECFQLLGAPLPAPPPRRLRTVQRNHLRQRVRPHITRRHAALWKAALHHVMFPGVWQKRGCGELWRTATASENGNQASSQA
jgi:hypothetical protein